MATTGSPMLFPGITCIYVTRRCQLQDRNPSSSERTVSRAADRLDVTDLGTVVRELFFSAWLAPASRQNYKIGTSQYLKFCHEQSRGTPFPASEPSLCLFIAWLHSQ